MNGEEKASRLVHQKVTVFNKKVSSFQGHIKRKIFNCFFVCSGKNINSCLFRVDAEQGSGTEIWLKGFEGQLLIEVLNAECGFRSETATCSKFFWRVVVKM
jgi:hypothetical protein